MLVFDDRDRRRAPRGAERTNGSCGLRRTVVVLERRLDREGLHAGIRTKYARHVRRPQVPAKWRTARAEDRIDRDAGLSLKGCEPVECAEREQDRGRESVVQRGIGAGNEHPLVGELFPLHVLADYPVGLEQIGKILDQRDDPDVRGLEVTAPRRNRNVAGYE